MRRPSLLLIVFLTMVLAVAPPLTISSFAQATTGGIRGVVSDPNGAVVPNAAIVAKNAGTGVEYNATATGDGLYAIPRIPAGRYNISVQVQGFKKAEYQD